MGLREWKVRAKALRLEIHALVLACRDRRTPWYAKLLGVCVVGYALSPIDLIPDFIPVIGYVDDLILVPAGILLLRRLIPAEVLADCQRRAEAAAEEKRPANWIVGGIIIAVWVAAAVWIGWWVWNRVG